MPSVGFEPRDVSADSETVVVLHGLWMPGMVTAVLAHRLTLCGFEAIRFSYPSQRRGLGDNAQRLADFLSAINSPIVHFVGHSLGGLLVWRLLRDFPEQRPGRVVLLGSPLAGSGVARHVSRSWVSPLLLGRSAGRELIKGVGAWPQGREAGAIAGSHGIGVGRILGGVEPPCDGTVAVAETRVPGIAEHLILATTHTGLLLSATAARQVCAFLKSGHFEPGVGPPVA
jgi:pimeloyl-ACP methyl ester carboxylesterase